MYTLQGYFPLCLGILVFFCKRCKIWYKLRCIDVIEMYKKNILTIIVYLANDVILVL